jgi:hypothetical protein
MSRQDACWKKRRFRLEGELRESYCAGRWQNDWLFGLLQQNT